jgi:hypothetical protein
MIGIPRLLRGALGLKPILPCHKAPSHGISNKNNIILKRNNAELVKFDALDLSQALYA